MLYIKHNKFLNIPSIKTYVEKPKIHLHAPDLKANKKKEDKKMTMTRDQFAAAVCYLIVRLNYSETFCGGKVVVVQLDYVI